jgi:hypothetical protein
MFIKKCDFLMMRLTIIKLKIMRLKDLIIAQAQNDQDPLTSILAQLGRKYLSIQEA